MGNGAGHRVSSHQEKDQTMVFDPPHGDPQPGDYIKLKPGNSLGTSEHETFVVVDDIAPVAGHLVLNLSPAHPDHVDWAAAVSPDEVARCSRITEEGSFSWTPSPDPAADE